MSTLSPRAASRGVDVLAILMAGSVAVALASLSWHLLGHTGTAAPVAVAAAPSGAAAAAPLDLAAVTAFAPFGVAVAAVAQGSPSDPAALGMQLRGVMLARPRSASTALISTGTTPAVAYAAGATLPGGAVLDAIEYDLVTLRVGGALQTLGFPLRPGDGSVAAPVSYATPAQSIPPQPTAQPVETLRNRLASDPKGLLDSLGASATPMGYQIGAGVAPAMRAAGLQPGDIIAKVNGTALGDVTQDKRVFDAAVQSGYARVDIVRDGKAVTLSFPLK